MGDEPMSDTERQNDRELRLLAQLDGIDDNLAWESLVAWMAPKLAAENNKLLAEIVIRRGLKRVESRRKVAGLPPPDVAEMLAQTFAAVGLRLEVA